MTPRERSERIRATATVDLGFDRCRIAAAGRIQHGDAFLKWLADSDAGTMAYLHRHQASRLDVRAWLPWARSVVVVALNYHQKSQKVKKSKSQNAGNSTSHRQSPIVNPQSTIPNRRSPIPNPQSSIPNRQSPLGRVAMYAWGEDYHVVLREKLETLAAGMCRMFDRPCRTRVCVDTSAIIERELAASAGIGWIGKNTMVLHAALGSYFFLGEIFTDLELAPDVPEPDHCGTCTRCLDACPTGALPRPYVMDARRCISYLTIEHRGEIDRELAAHMGDWVFGCDACQTVCPFNHDAPHTTEPRLCGTPADAAPSLDDILSWDEAVYKARVRGKATARAKLHMWKRNADIARRNTGPSPSH